MLTTTVFQAAILMLYNIKDVYTLGEIEQQTKIDAQHLSPSLLALCRSHNLLKKENKNPLFDNLNETFAINLGWTSQLLKVNTAPNAKQIQLFVPKESV